VSFIGILLSVGDGARAVTTEAPQWALSRRGKSREHQGCSTGTLTVTLCLQRKSSPLCEKIWLCRLFRPWLAARSCYASSCSKGALQNDICRFESYMPSQPVRSPLCDFRVCENRRHSRGLGWRALVSGWQILELQVRTGGFVEPVSARHFPISVSACPRPVRYVTETGLRSRFRACTAAKV